MSVDGRRRGGRVNVPSVSVPDRRHIFSCSVLSRVRNSSIDDCLFPEHSPLACLQLFPTDRVFSYSEHRRDSSLVLPCSAGPHNDLRAFYINGNYYDNIHLFIYFFNKFYRSPENIFSKQQKKHCFMISQRGEFQNCVCVCAHAL